MLRNLEQSAALRHPHSLLGRTCEDDRHRTGSWRVDSSCGGLSAFATTLQCRWSESFCVNTIIADAQSTKPVIQRLHKRGWTTEVKIKVAKRQMCFQQVDVDATYLIILFLVLSACVRTIACMPRRCAWSLFAAPD